MTSPRREPGPWPTPYAETGDRIRTRRKELGLTQAQVAERVGVVATAQTSWELGRWLPRYAAMLALAAVLETTAEALFGAEVVAAGPGRRAS